MQTVETKIPKINRPGMPSFPTNTVVYHRNSIVFAFRAGRYIHVDEVKEPDGDCICELCQSELVAIKNDDQRGPHFTHKFEDACSNDGETGLSFAAASMIQEAQKFYVPNFKQKRSVVLGGLRAVSWLSLVPSRSPAWRMLVMRIERRPVHLVIRPVLRLRKLKQQPIFSDRVPAILIAINPGLPGIITAGDLEEILFNDEAESPRLTFLKKWLWPPHPSL